jgi:hypothetical protein
LRPCRDVDDGSGDVDPEEFVGVCAKLGVQVTLAEAAELFKRAGYDRVMPYQKWAQNLITQPSRQLAQESAGKCWPKAWALLSVCIQFNGWWLLLGRRSWLLQLHTLPLNKQAHEHNHPQY